MNVNETKVLINELDKYYTLFLEQLPQIGMGIILFLIFYGLSGPLSRTLVRPLKYAQTSMLIKVVTRRLISLVIVLFGLYLFLRMAGLSAFAVAILSGTGVAGLIIGFAFKDIAENFMSSLLLSIQKPFKLGDVIEVDGHIGVVKQVTARATTLVDFDGTHIQIPNANVYKNTIRNYTANPNSRGHFVIGIGYDADVSEAQAIGIEVLSDMDAVLDDPEPQILVNELASSTLNLKVYYWTDTHKFSLLKVSSLAMKRIVKAFDAAGISMPDDAREVVIPQGVPVHHISDKNSPLAREKTAPEATTPDSNADINTIAKAVVSAQDEDLESDDNDIRKQAMQAREPEQGQNIL